jgi:hypothetical protein
LSVATVSVPLANSSLWMEAFEQDAALAVALALLAVLEPALLLELLPQAASPTLAVSAVIAATAATVICRIRLLVPSGPLLSSGLVGFWATAYSHAATRRSKDIYGTDRAAALATTTGQAL